MEFRVAHDWRLRGQRYRLESDVCDYCGATIFPPRDICPECKRPLKKHTYDEHRLELRLQRVQ